jgi:hypothetical protein
MTKRANLISSAFILLMLPSTAWSLPGNCEVPFVGIGSSASRPVQQSIEAALNRIGKNMVLATVAVGLKNGIQSINNVTPHYSDAGLASALRRRHSYEMYLLVLRSGGLLLGVRESTSVAPVDGIVTGLWKINKIDEAIGRMKWEGHFITAWLLEDAFCRRRMAAAM